MINFVLKQKGNGYYFSNPKTDTENEIFYNKQDGISILLDYLEKKIVSTCRTLKLIEEICALRYFPTIRELETHQLDHDIIALIMIRKLRKSLEKLSKMESETNLPKFKICMCGEHGEIIGEDFISIELPSKEDARDTVEELFGGGKINHDGRKKLEREIEQSTLPEKVNVVNPSLN